MPTNDNPDSRVMKGYHPDSFGVGPVDETVYGKNIQRLDNPYVVDDNTAITKTQADITKVCNDIHRLLIEKNISYGDSALSPVRIFSRANPIEQLKVRIDDKLSRFTKGTDYPNDNDIDDLIGYLVLLKIALARDEVRKHPWAP